jgi:protein-disulfide isomerase
MWILALPDYISNRLVYPRAQSAQDSEQATRALELWHTAPVQNISFTAEAGFLSDSFKGSADAPVTIVEFSDFQCPACRSAHLALSPIWEEFGDRVLFVHKNYPLDHACNPSIPQPFHRLSCFAAEFVRCAGEQGMFPQAADLMFRSPVLNKNRDGEAEKAALFDAGEQLGFDRVGLEECVASGRHRAKIVADIAEADGLGLEGTPTFWIAGKKVPSISPEVIRSVLLEALSDSSK